MKLSKESNALVTGWLVGDPKFSQVGSESIPKVSFAINPCLGKDAPLVSVVAWREMAEICRALHKRDRVLVAGTIGVREYQGKTYTDLTADFVLAMPHPDEQLSLEGMKEITPEDIPF